jgi:hypothetical protein
LGPKSVLAELAPDAAPAGAPRLPFAGAVRSAADSGASAGTEDIPLFRHWIICHFRTPGYPAARLNWMLV